MSATRKEVSTESQTNRAPEAPASPAPIQFYGGYQVYSESGVDLTLLRENLKRPIEQRWENLYRALHLVDEIDRSREAHKSKNGTKGRNAILLDMPGILRLLQSGGVDYVVIGGLAMICHGSAYVTKDVDLCYSRSAKNIHALAACCAAVHPYLRGAPQGLPFRFDAATIQAGLNFTLTTDLGDIDFLGEISGIGGYEKAVAMSEEKEIYGMKVRVLSLEGLIAAKKAAGRTKDQLHLLELQELKKMRDQGAGS